MNTKPIFNGVVIIALAVAVYVIVTAFSTSHKTGLLEISTSDKSALLSISQNGRAAAGIGKGSAKVRLPAGSYYVAASASGHQNGIVVTINKGGVVKGYVDLAHSNALPSANNTEYRNVNALINSGLTVTQINLLKQYFFQYKPTAQLITIDGASVQPGPHNPDVDTSFTINFNLTIDSIPYSATVKYTDTTSISLYLYDTQHNLKYSQQPTDYSNPDETL